MTRRHSHRALAALGAAALALTGCGTGTADLPQGATGDCVEDYEEGRDYFPDKAAVEASELWDITYHDSYKVLELADTEDPAAPPLRYVLYQCGTPEPDPEGDLADALFVQVPVTSAAVTSFNALAMIDRLGQNGTVTGLSGQLLGNGETDSWYADVIDQAPEPMSVGEYTDLDREVLLGLANEVIFMSGFGTGFDDITTARAADLPAVSVANRLEPHALASAEWIKAVAAFYNAEAAANAEYEGIRDRFNATVAAVTDAGAAEGKSVGYLCVTPDFGCDFLHAHGEDTVNGRLLTALGATNPFAANNDGPNGRPYDYEEALGAAADADFFILYDPLADVAPALEADPRKRDFSPLAAGDYIAGVDERFQECRAKSYLDVDVLIRDFAIGLAPDLFPTEQGACYVAND